MDVTILYEPLVDDRHSSFSIPILLFIQLSTSAALDGYNVGLERRIYKNPASFHGR